MSKLPLDLSKFKRASSSDGETTLQHPDGHRLTLLHSALDKTKLSALNALPMLTQESKLPNRRMADGGDVKEPTPAPNPSPNNAPSVTVAVEPPAAQAPAAEAPPASPSLVPAEEGIDDFEDAPASAPAPQVAAAPAAAQPPQSEHAPQAQPSAPEPAAPAHIGQAMTKDPVANQQTILNEMSQVQQEMASTRIKPETYQSIFDNKGTAGKISTIFGLLLGGAGAGLTHQQNPLTAMWDRQISNDLESQKANFGNKSTLFSSLQNQFGDVESASAMARLYMDRAAFQHLVDQGKDLPPAQKAQYDSGLGMLSQFLDTRAASAANQIAMKQALVKSLQEQPGGAEPAYQQQQNLLRRGDEKMQHLAEENDKHHVPGFPGQSSVPIPQETRDRIAALKQYEDKAQEYVEFAKKHAMNWANLNLADRARVANEGAAMGANLQSLYRNKIKGGVYKKGEQEFIEQIIPDQPASWSASLKSIPKVMQTLHDNRADLANTASAYGLRMPQATAARSAAPAQPAQYKISGGIKYMRGPNGEAIPVQ